MNKTEYRIVLYGLSKYTVFVERALLPQCTIVGYTDSYAEVSLYGNKPFYKLDELPNVQFDYIIICVGDLKISDKITRVLVEQAGIDENKILDIVKLLKRQRVDAIMSQETTQKYDGIVLGNSMASWGINPRLLKGNWCNLAVDGEDIYYHWCVLKKIYEVYPEKIDKLKYLVIDLWDYPVFNFDLSLSTGLFYYFNCYGYMEDEHNYSTNTNCQMSVEKGMLEKNFYGSMPTERNQKLSQELFDDTCIRKYYDNFFRIYSQGGKIPSKTGCYIDYREVDLFDSGISKSMQIPSHAHLACTNKYYADTNQENRDIIMKMLAYVKERTPELQIYFTLMPRYYCIENIHDTNLQMRRYKEDFLSVMSQASKEYQSILLNYKDNMELSTNNHFYRDEAHFNSIGANAFTSLLCETIF